MATIKEEVMTVKDDCQYVRALDANGNSIRISKEDLAKVLGELLLLGGYLPKDADLNNFQKNAVYYVTGSGSPSYVNFPTGAYHYGILIVLTPMAESVIQIYIPDQNDQSCYIRILNSKWYPWRKFTGIEL